MNDCDRGSLVGRLLLAASVSLVLLSCGMAGLSLGLPPVSTRAQRLADAENRWLARAVTHYRLVMQAPSWCRLDVEIRNEQVVQVFENSCPAAPRTVSNLFEQIRQLDSTANLAFCAPKGCECTEVRFAEAVYDQELGFPRSIQLRRQRQTNWREFWRFFVAHGMPNCLTPRDLDVVDVVSLKQMS